ncbi:hypothetical protein A3C09_02660 [Candidatus Uhrbacteria bacterium RIFCSPHIGHO2_02_FULL_47_44]|uniref:Uncharacterized protein n=1 Tax=Candidatus Uhrbacteria bacterium RIFCSPLOWO2_02_FULL_48_18 TaxID=1802408 RepID=A0A1F7V7B1_9BACT|nr:MAG: hypothetical protein A3C09_02660 [Candidatus Uhrbacteria bacterium RIFCSPHIGHO2_02_FULL_47_44]OGL77110.1 MAG: hypothetical protein A3E97_03405 [Candidatus Uhrbacteria bacterium RIFCSPHIGHO2_12_FULL_47_12]OGL80451.1 MAG: hypothetical protein A3B20_03505 [Candidatus Uhrbacteria bacterium RIFCSPLOWO2_01_FULL_47_17]OGL86311.1 MAG: hypothetical protein A3I41_01985 [Candidatus Uhrbacteria bacterium RIFCSPLOWO2_02_FULL_48_18]OGL94063.1 MAG: hypothetical protein A3H12_01110 [Candidatus Uhrbacte
MGKRRLNGEHIQVRLPETLFSLPEGYTDKLRAASYKGGERTASILEKKEAISEGEFALEQETYRQIAGENLAFFHLLMSCYLSRMVYDFERIAFDHRASLRNKYLIAAMSQKELTIACLYLKPKIIPHIPSWDKHIHMGYNGWWASHFYGAVTVARVARRLLQEGAEVRLPTAAEDIDDKIDLIASFKGRSEGLCMQIKSDDQVEWIQHRVCSGLNPNREPESLRRFLLGTRKFQDQYRGIWIPIELTLGSKPFQDGTTVWRGPIVDIFHTILTKALEEHDPSLRAAM